MVVLNIIKQVGTHEKARFLLKGGTKVHDATNEGVILKIIFIDEFKVKI